jgi:hypothetical protein
LGNGGKTVLTLTLARPYDARLYRNGGFSAFLGLSRAFNTNRRTR